MFVLCDDSETNHVIDELIKTTWSEVAKAIRGLCGQAMTAMIVSVNHKLIFNQNFGQLCISADVLTKSVGDLNDSANIARIAPFYAGNSKAVAAFKFKSRSCTHHLI